ncbi:hypothetical protein BDZ85DRAFT_312568 [Elsinoe ampelina]|uniref:Uncharacterized protein n=1 Tax=Elsinoe ampelina TaxID=302913 RepID=A0A6A6GBF2_9PEZI|nr:hypothetical protein BDZ85DRAFT_312568 [Elsinoe ampelina]
MLSIKAFTILMPLSVLAVPLSGSSQEIRVIWSRQVGSGATVLKVFTSDSSSILAEATTTRIDGGLFASEPLSVDVNDTGAGTLVLGDKTYTITTDRERSGGISCTRMYTNEQAFVNCLVPFSGDLGLVRRGPMKDAATLRAEMSVGALPAFQDLSPLIKRDNALPEQRGHNLSPPAIFNETRLTKRQREPWPVQTTVLHGDGNPAPELFPSTEDIQCSQNGCSATYTQGDSFTVGWSASFPIFKWIGGGFNVGMTWTTSEGTTCNGNPGEEVCVWYNTAHTAYTVENWTTDDVCMNNERMESLSIVKSPNALNRGGKMYCVIGTCRAVTDSYWDNTPVPGGPSGELP